MIEQIRRLQNAKPFESFALELTNGRVIQVSDRHQVATTSGTLHGEEVIGILRGAAQFEVIRSSQVVSVSVGVHPKLKEQLAQRIEEVQKRFGGGTSSAEQNK